MPTVLTDVVARLATRDPSRTEADLQADIYTLLTAGGLSLSAGQVARLEVPTGDGTRRRLDVEVGHAVIEVKKDLRPIGTRTSAEEQLAGYVRTRTRDLGTRYVGILTDGVDWHLYHLREDRLYEVASLSILGSGDDEERLSVWLEAVLTTETGIRPSPLEINRRLGANSPAYRLDCASLAALYRAGESVPEVALKRQLWAKLLRTSFGKSFVDNQALFIDHTLLVLSAEMIAHAVVGFDITTGDLSPVALTRGTAFASAQIYGVVEADFFDWVLHVDGGREFIQSLARNIGRFDWSHVEHDVLKVLYESVIVAEWRASLGEYYTPDWLAERMVLDTITDPLTERVLDPACGSGTFIFHAVRRYLTEAASSGRSIGEAVEDVTSHVYGMDVHPVAVTLARVTYLLAIGRERLAAIDRGPISVPVYLGDSLQWEQRTDLLGGIDNVSISTRGDDIVDTGSGNLFGDDLVFPSSILADAGDFDRIVTAMADKAVEETSRSAKQMMRPILRQFGIPDSDHEELVATFDTMRRLHAEGRDHIWGYYVRNLIRPLWLSEPEHRVEVLIGNPPWLRYSKMTSSMQERYKTLAKERKLLTGGLGASARDLSTLFVVRAVELYLREGGHFCFVMPHGVLTRKPHDGFRSGSWDSASGTVIGVSFDKSWDLANVKPTGFPMTSAVVRGSSTPRSPHRMPNGTHVWSGRLPQATIGWEAADNLITISDGMVEALSSTDNSPVSPYKKRFRQGAILVPRRLMFVVDGPVSPLGAGAGRVSVVSRCTTADKPPWKYVRPISATVERAFVRDVHLGETVLPYRTLEPLRAVLPVTDSGILSADEIEEHSGLASWWNQAELAWSEHRVERESLPLVERFNYLHQLSSQFPAARNRVVYTKSGNRLAAARVSDPTAIIDHKLYWAATSTVAEARYLVGILNSETVMSRVEPLMAIGLFGRRDFDKNVFRVPVPSFNATDARHLRLASIVEDAERIVLETDVGHLKTFQERRTLVRDALEAQGVSGEIDALVAQIIPDISGAEPRRGEIVGSP